MRCDSNPGIQKTPSGQKQEGENSGASAEIPNEANCAGALQAERPSGGSAFQSIHGFRITGSALQVFHQVFGLLASQSHPETLK